MKEPGMMSLRKYTSSLLNMHASPFHLAAIFQYVYEWDIAKHACTFLVPTTFSAVDFYLCRYFPPAVTASTTTTTT